MRLGIDPLGAIVNSLRTAALATVFAVTIGALAALAITAARRLGRLLDAGLMLPIATSAVTIGFGILITFDQPPVDWRASPLIVPIGQALVAVPFVVRIALPVLRGIDPRLHEAAGTLGASPARAWREITLAHLRRPAPGRRRAGRRHLARRVRRHQLPVPARRRDDADRDRPACSVAPATWSRVRRTHWPRSSPSSP